MKVGFNSRIDSVEYVTEITIAEEEAVFDSLEAKDEGAELNTTEPKLKEVLDIINKVK